MQDGSTTMTLLACSLTQSGVDPGGGYRGCAGGRPPPPPPPPPPVTRVHYGLCENGESLKSVTLTLSFYCSYSPLHISHNKPRLPSLNSA